MKARIVFIGVILLSFWCLIISKSVILQVLPNKKLSQLEKKKFKKVVTLNARRGGIYDRNKKELAATIPSYSLYADPKLIKHPRRVSKKIAKYFRSSYRPYYKKMKKKKRRFSWIKRHLNKKQRDEIKSWKIRGIAFIEEPKRIYPNENLLSQVIGFVGSEDQGLEGLELKFDADLKGESKKIRLQRDARGRPLLLNGQVFVDQPDGSNLNLTIDSSLQFKLEKELSLAVDRFDAESAVGIVLDAQTSEILAMANVPTFNTNSKSKARSQFLKNRTITDSFEPGSTLKSFVIAGALAKSVVKPNTKINCENGQFKIGNRIIREADTAHSFKELTVSEVLVHSSNVGTSKIALKLGDKELRNIYQNFGFGVKTGVDLPGETTGILQKTPWRDHLLANISFGHGITTTPLQIASAYASLANGGVLKKPYIVKSIVDLETGEKKFFKEEKIRRVLTESQARTMRLMLTNVTAENGTGYNARVYGFPVAGKTGTAQKVNPNGRGYLPGAYISSFAGFVPANNPKFVVYIAVDSPKLQYYGSVVAAPVFSKVASYALLKSGLPPVLLHKTDIISKKIKTENKEQKAAIAKIQKSIPKDRVPFLEGLSLREVYRRMKDAQVEVRVSGSGRVVKSWPEAGHAIPKNKKIRVKLQ